MQSHTALDFSQVHIMATAPGVLGTRRQSGVENVDHDFEEFVGNELSELELAQMENEEYTEDGSATEEETVEMPKPMKKMVRHHEVDDDGESTLPSTTVKEDNMECQMPTSMKVRQWLEKAKEETQAGPEESRMDNPEELAVYFDEMYAKALNEKNNESSKYQLQNIISTARRNADHLNFLRRMRHHYKEYNYKDLAYERLLVHMEVAKDGYTKVQPIANMKLAQYLVPTYRILDEDKYGHARDLYSLGIDKPFWDHEFMKSFYINGVNTSSQQEVEVGMMWIHMNFMYMLDDGKIKYVKPNHKLRDEVDEGVLEHLEREFYESQHLDTDDKMFLTTDIANVHAKGLNFDEPKAFVKMLEKIRERTNGYNEILRIRASSQVESHIGDYGIPVDAQKPPPHPFMYNQKGPRLLMPKSQWTKQELDSPTTPNAPVNIWIPGSNGNAVVPQIGQEHQDLTSSQGRTGVNASVITYQPNPINGQTEIEKTVRDFYGGIDLDQLRKNDREEYDKEYLQNIELGLQGKVTDKNRTDSFEQASQIAVALGSDQTDIHIEEMVNEIRNLALERHQTPIETDLAYANLLIAKDGNDESENVEKMRNALLASECDLDEDEYYEINALEDGDQRHEYVSTGILTTRLQEQKDKLEQKRIQMDNIRMMENQIRLFRSAIPTDLDGNPDWRYGQEELYNQMKTDLEQAIQKLEEDSLRLSTELEAAEKIAFEINPRLSMPDFSNVTDHNDEKIESDAFQLINQIDRVGGRNKPQLEKAWNRLRVIGQMFNFNEKKYKLTLPLIFDEQSNLSTHVSSIRHLPLEEILYQMNQLTGETLPSLSTKIRELERFKLRPGENLQAAMLRAENLIGQVVSTKYTPEKRAIMIDSKMEDCLQKCLSDEQADRLHRIQMNAIRDGMALTGKQQWQEAIGLYSGWKPYRSELYSIECDDSEDEGFQNFRQGQTNGHGRTGKGNDKENVEDDKIMELLNNISTSVSRIDRDNRMNNRKKRSEPYPRDRSPMLKTESAKSRDLEKAKKVTFATPMEVDEPKQRPLLRDPSFDPTKQTNSMVFPAGSFENLPSLSNEKYQDSQGNQRTGVEQHNNLQFRDQARGRKPDRFGEKSQFGRFPQGQNGRFNRQHDNFNQSSQTTWNNAPKSSNNFDNNMQRQQDLRNFSNQQNMYGRDSSLVRNNNRQPTGFGGVCYNCGRSGHIARECPNKEFTNRGNGNYRGNSNFRGITRIRGMYRGNNNNSYSRGNNNYRNGNQGKIIQNTFSTNDDDNQAYFKSVMKTLCHNCGPEVDPHPRATCHMMTKEYQDFKSRFYNEQSRNRRGNNNFLERRW